jgi:hypothetical protein
MRMGRAAWPRYPFDGGPFKFAERSSGSGNFRRSPTRSEKERSLTHRSKQCLECGGDGNREKFGRAGPNYPCPDSKGAGYQLVSV